MNIHNRRYKKFLFVVFPILVITILWIGAKLASGFSLEFSKIPLYISQIFSLWGITFFTLDLIISTRMKWVEKVFGGLDKAFQLHDRIARVAGVLILAHPILLAITSLSNTDYLIGLFIPFVNPELMRVTGVLSFYIMLLLILLAVFRFLPYQIWKFLHKFMGVAYILAGYHILTVFSDTYFYPPLRLWVFGMLLVGGVFWFYKIFLYRNFGPRFKYTVDEIKQNVDVHELYLKPVRERINFEPGEFVFMRLPGNDRIPSEEHPFTISSPPSWDRIRISFKVYGDYTKDLAMARVGDEVDLYGPYGEFTSYMFDSYKKQIWICGGIGITPFMSMLNYEAFNKDEKDIYFYYTTPDKEHAVYDNEIQSIVDNADDNIRYMNRTDDELGFIDAKWVSEQVGEDLEDYLILVCGPPIMMHNLYHQFVELGVDPYHVVFEDFNFS